MIGRVCSFQAEFRYLGKSKQPPFWKAAILGTDPVRDLELFLVFQAQ
jgi:hypothetical protein